MSKSGLRWPLDLLVFALASSLFWISAAVDDDAEEQNITKTYEAPIIDGLHWAETFDGDVWSRWSKSNGARYTGEFKVETRTKESLVGDVGLHVPEEAKHYGAAAILPPIEGKQSPSFVVQFEVQFQNGLDCGGSYIKLFDSEGKAAEEFKDDTRFVIMFGPDRCGATNKVHFILQHKSPKTGRWEEKHCKDAPTVPGDQLTHLYALVIKPDNTFEIRIDGQKKTSGNLLTSMEPPINPPEEIDDPADSKPGDWIDEAKIDDPASSKPDDWDEDAPMQIVDPKASKPSGWNDDAPLKIADPEAKQPADWDDEEDGEWEAPIINNPACKVGCGNWEAPKISNPAYKGKWHAPKIDNPAYQGVWKAKQLPNPDFFVDESPAILPKIDAVGIDIWTMNRGIIFDNIVISTDIVKAVAFAEQTFKVRKEIEVLLNKPKSSKSDANKYWIPAVVTCVVLSITTVFLCMRRSGREILDEEPRKSAPAKSDKPKDEGKDDKNEDENGKDVVTEKSEKKEETAEMEPQKEKETAEGGLGDLTATD